MTQSQLNAIKLENLGYVWTFDFDSRIWELYDSLSEDGIRINDANKEKLIDTATKLVFG